MLYNQAFTEICQQKNSNASTVVAHNAANTVSLEMKQNCVKT